MKLMLSALTYNFSLHNTGNFRYALRTYALKVHKLATSIASKIADSLGYKYSFEGWSGLLRPNKYKFDKESLGSVGVITHTDSGFLTILQEDELIGGLEIMDNSGSYLAVDPVPGSFIVFLGDVAKVIEYRVNV